LLVAVSFLFLNFLPNNTLANGKSDLGKNTSILLRYHLLKAIFQGMKDLYLQESWKLRKEQVQQI
jgi:hypothetical protein